MTREQILQWAQQCGFGGQARVTNSKRLEQFAAFVSAAEREACAKVCDEKERANLYGVRECAAAIRARGEK